MAQPVNQSVPLVKTVLPLSTLSILHLKNTNHIFMLTTIVSLYMFLGSFMNSTNLMATLPHETQGEYYAPAKIEYKDGNTYAVWVRYYVWGEKFGQFGSYNVTATGGQVWVYKGTLSKDEIKKEGRSRADARIVVDVK